MIYLNIGTQETHLKNTLSALKYYEKANYLTCENPESGRAERQRIKTALAVASLNLRQKGRNREAKSLIVCQTSELGPLSYHCESKGYIKEGNVVKKVSGLHKPVVRIVKSESSNGIYKKVQSIINSSKDSLFPILKNCQYERYSESISSYQGEDKNRKMSAYLYQTETQVPKRQNSAYIRRHQIEKEKLSQCSSSRGEPDKKLLNSFFSSFEGREQKRNEPQLLKKFEMKTSTNAKKGLMKIDVDSDSEIEQLKLLGVLIWNEQENIELVKEEKKPVEKDNEEINQASKIIITSSEDPETLTREKLAEAEYRQDGNVYLATLNLIEKIELQVCLLDIPNKVNIFREEFKLKNECSKIVAKTNWDKIISKSKGNIKEDFNEFKKLMLSEETPIFTIIEVEEKAGMHKVEDKIGKEPDEKEKGKEKRIEVKDHKNESEKEERVVEPIYQQERKEHLDSKQPTMLQNDIMKENVSKEIKIENALISEEDNSNTSKESKGISFIKNDNNNMDIPQSEQKIDTPLNKEQSKQENDSISNQIMLYSTCLTLPIVFNEGVNNETKKQSVYVLLKLIKSESKIFVHASDTKTKVIYPAKFYINENANKNDFPRISSSVLAIYINILDAHQLH